jgi:hypothetical protein
VGKLKGVLGKTISAIAVIGVAAVGVAAVFTVGSVITRKRRSGAECSESAVTSPDPLATADSQTDTGTILPRYQQSVNDGDAGSDT